MMLLKHEVHPAWLSSLRCPPCAPLGTSPAGKGSFPKHGRNFSSRQELGPEGDQCSNKATQGPSAKSLTLAKGSC